MCAPRRQPAHRVRPRAPPARSRSPMPVERAVADLGIRAERSRANARASRASAGTTAATRAVHDVHGGRRERQQRVEAVGERHEREVEPDERAAGADAATHAEPDRQARRRARPRTRAARARVSCIISSSEQIDAGFGERLGELEVRGALGALVGIGVRVEARRQARDRACDRDVAAARVARFACGRDGARVDAREFVADGRPPRARTASSRTCSS